VGIFLPLKNPGLLPSFDLYRISALRLLKPRQNDRLLGESVGGISWLFDLLFGGGMEYRIGLLLPQPPIPRFKLWDSRPQGFFWFPFHRYVYTFSSSPLKPLNFGGFYKRSSDG